MRRREFLHGAAAAVGLSRLGPARWGDRGRGPAAAGRQEWPDLDGRLVINGLGGLSNPNLRYVGDTAEASGPVARPDGLDPRAVADALDAGLHAINLTMGYVSGPMDPFEHTVADVARWGRWIRDEPRLTRVLSTEDILAARNEGRVGIIAGFQNAAMIEDSLERVEIFADLGVRIIQLTYNVRNRVGDGSMVPENRGLTDLGRQVVEALQDRGILVDLSHSGEQTCLDAARAATAPIAITHTGCRAVADLPRNKTDEELRLVADGGGVVGIYFMPFLDVSGQPTAETVVRHLEHAIQVCGEDHVGIGTDGGTTRVDDMDAYRAVIRAEVEERVASGVAATGETADVIPMVADLHGPSQFRKLAGMLRERGHPWTRVEKILGGNFLRLFSDVWPVA